MTDSHSACRPDCCRAAVALAAFIFLLGCGKGDDIRSYTVPKEPEPQRVAATAPAETAEPTDRMLAAIVPAGGQAWFFKAVGPTAAVDKHADEIVAFFSTIRVADGERARWELPAEWKEDAGSGMRAATIWVPAEGKPIEMSVTTLPWSGSQADLLNNVNRWRGQMQLPPIGAPALATDARELQAGDAKITVVDLRGRFSSGMMAPFAGGAGGGLGAPPMANDAIPPGHPPIDATTSAPGNTPTGEAAAFADTPKFEVPSAWQQKPVLPGEMRKAAFGIADGGQEAMVTVIDFSAKAGPKIADPLQNVNRWRGELSMSPIEEDELAGAVETMEIDGQPATYAAIIPDPSKPEESRTAEATLAAMAPHGERIWFIKMKGPRDLVAAQQDQFKSFLKSIRFPADGGANHGN